MKEEIKKIHRGDLLTLLKIYNLKNIFNSIPFWSAIIMSLIIFLFLENTSVLLTFKFIVDSGYKVIPSIIGLAFAAFGIILSTSNSYPISKLIDNSFQNFESERKIGFSKFQRVLAVISWAILVQSFFLILLIIVDYMILLEISFPYMVYVSVELWNKAILFFFSFVFLYSIFLIPRTLLNLFNYGQIVNFVSLLQKLIEEKNKIKE